jgi:hypothetical protein
MADVKLDILVHYVCARCDNPSDLGATKLNKVLWYSDVLAFATLGESITGAIYIKRQFGPVPKHILDSRARLEASNAIVVRDAPYGGGYLQKQFIALRAPDISMFSPEQISIVDGVLQEICRNHTATSISQLSHDIVWQSAEIGEEIPMSAAAFAGGIGEIDEVDMSWAQQEIDRIEGVRALA